MSGWLEAVYDMAEEGVSMLDCEDSFVTANSKSVGDGAEWRLCGGYKIMYQ